jgi:predicted nucleic acid-binding protein
MVYLDTSVALAHLRAEDVRPPDALWDESLVSSRLIVYEMLARLHAAGKGETHGEAAREILARVALLELIEPIVGRAAEPFPVPLRTLDALHLASILFLKGQGIEARLATYDRRLAAGAEAVGIRTFPL